MHHLRHLSFRPREPRRRSVRGVESLESFEQVLPGERKASDVPAGSDPMPWHMGLLVHKPVRGPRRRAARILAVRLFLSAQVVPAIPRLQSETDHARKANARADQLDNGHLLGVEKRRREPGPEVIRERLCGRPARMISELLLAILAERDPAPRAELPRTTSRRLWTRGADHVLRAPEDRGLLRVREYRGPGTEFFRMRREIRRLRRGTAVELEV